jgi:hypothetical protein
MLFCVTNVVNVEGSEDEPVAVVKISRKKCGEHESMT